MFNLAVTGHRPKKIGKDCYNVNSDLSKRWIAFFKKYIKELKITPMSCTSGMALGIDTLFAIAVLQLQNEGYNIQLICAIPCNNHDCKWQAFSKTIYKEILLRANKIVNVTNKNYTNTCMQKRNEYMVDNASQLLAIWDGSHSGTGNCVQYANKIGIDVDIVNPSIMNKKREVK